MVALFFSFSCFRHCWTVMSPMSGVSGGGFSAAHSACADVHMKDVPCPSWWSVVGLSLVDEGEEDEVEVGGPWP